jgi:hypothetical protein
MRHSSLKILENQKISSRAAGETVMAAWLYESKEPGAKVPGSLLFVS